MALLQVSGCPISDSLQEDLQNSCAKDGRNRQSGFERLVQLENDGHWQHNDEQVGHNIDHSLRHSPICQVIASLAHRDIPVLISMRHAVDKSCWDQRPVANDEADEPGPDADPKPAYGLESIQEEDEDSGFGKEHHGRIQ